MVDQGASRYSAKQSPLEFKFLPTSGDIRTVLLELLEMVSRGRYLPDRASGCRDISPFLPYILYTFWLNQHGYKLRG
jgi:hypothetical protein